MFIHSLSSLVTIPDSRPKWAKSIPVLDQSGANILPFGVAHIYMAYIRKYSPGENINYIITLDFLL